VAKMSEYDVAAKVQRYFFSKMIQDSRQQQKKERKKKFFFKVRICGTATCQYHKLVKKEFFIITGNAHEHYQ
jgi:hypothetical protein